MKETKGKNRFSRRGWKKDVVEGREGLWEGSWVEGGVKFVLKVSQVVSVEIGGGGGGAEGLEVKPTLGRCLCGSQVAPRGPA